MDKTQIKAMALNAACVRLAGINDIWTVDQTNNTIINMAKEFEKYLKGDLDE